MYIYRLFFYTTSVDIYGLANCIGLLLLSFNELNLYDVRYYSCAVVFPEIVIFC